MIRLHEFVTKIRNCKTQAEERAEYQKQMAAIRQSFAKNEETLRPRNVTKLLFINMSGQQTNFGQMQCLKLITAHSLIQKRIGYLGLTQLFHQKSQLLMMATHRIRIDLSSNNNNVVSLVLCILSQICTNQLAKDLHMDVLKCCSNSSAFIRKKAILTSIKVIKRVPEYINQFLAKISTCLEEKSHGVLLASMAFLEHVVQIDESFAEKLVNLVPKIARAYRLIAQEHNVEYQIGGVQDPFLQVAILKFLRTLRKYSATFDKQFAEILVICHDSVCSRVSSNNLKNGANAVLFECFQCFMNLDPTPQLREMVANVLSKFISVKDANSKYLSLFNLNLMTKYDLKIVKTHKATIFECLNQKDIQIKIMALDLLYVIAGSQNSQSIVKDLLNVLWNTTDEEFIRELALKICMIVEKHSINRRWHFDTILKVLVIADEAVKQQSAKSLVYLVQSTPQLQQYCLAKLFFSTVQNPQNNALGSVTLFLIGEFSNILFRIRDVQISQQHTLDLIESIIFKAGINHDTIAYGLSCLLKLYEKFSNKERISKMIRSFEAHSDHEVQKRACEYVKLLEKNWDEDRKKEICIPVEAFKLTAEVFKSIPVGDTEMDMDLTSLRMPNQMGVNYDDHIVNQDRKAEPLKVAMGQKDQVRQPSSPSQVPASVSVPVTQPPVKSKPAASLMDDDDLFSSGGQSQETKSVPAANIDAGLGDFSFTPTTATKPAPSNDIFSMGLDFGGSSNQPQPSSSLPQSNSGLGGDLLGFGAPSQPPPLAKNNGGGDLMGFDFGSGPTQPSSQPAPTNNNMGGFSFDTHSTPPPSQPSPPVNQHQSNLGFDVFGGSTSSQPVSRPPPTSQNASFQPIKNTNPNKILAYQNQHIQMWMDCIKQGQQTSKLFTTYINKSNSTLTNLTIQAAVVKHVKLTINPLSSTTLQPFSREVVHQTMMVVNSLVGQKGVVMKMKISYSIATQNFNFQEKISNFPTNV